MPTNGGGYWRWTSRSSAATSSSRTSTPWSTPPTAGCSAAAASTAPSSAPAGPTSWPPAARSSSGSARCRPGQAAATDAGTMPARWVIHVVGPVYSTREDRRDLLASCYRRALAVADELGARSRRLPGGVGRDLRVADRRRRRRGGADRGRHPDSRRGRALRALQRRGARPVPAGARRARPGDPARGDRPAGRRRPAATPPPDDLDALQTAIEESRDHLRPWMPWADQSRAEDTADVPARRRSRGGTTARSIGYLLVDGADGSVLGGGGLHRRLGPDGHRDRLLAAGIGRWPRASSRRSPRALTDVGVSMPDIDRVEIHCDEANTTSAAIPRRLGYALDRLDDRVVTVPASTDAR